MNLDYKYRPDGNFLVRCTCSSCGEQWDSHAMSNSDPAGYCAACRQVADWEKEQPK